MRKGVGHLPVLDGPLLVRENRVTRISWTVVDVHPSLLGSSARLVLRADERRLESIRPFKAMLHPVILLILVPSCWRMRLDSSPGGSR
jgi:hypothetical protein